MNILIVDDEQGFLDQAKTILENINDDFEIITSSSVNEGLEVLEDKNIDVLVSDYKMPGKDGIDFLKIFKEKLDGDTPFIIFTGKGSEEVAKKALNLGANRYIEKGEDMKNQLNTLSNAIEDELKKKREIKEWKESEHKYRSLLNQAAEMLFLHDTDGNIIEVNQAAIDNTGYSRDELLQMNIFDIDPDAEERRDQTNYWKNLSPQDPPTKIEVRHKRKDGSVYPAEVVLSKVILSGEEYVFAIARDITERKETQKKLEEEQHRRKVILDNIPGIAFILKKDSREIVFSNKKAKEVGAVPGKTCYETVAERDDPCPFCKAPELWETDEKQDLEVEYKIHITMVYGCLILKVNISTTYMILRKEKRQRKN
ncbi:MAG: PAS domain S-box protein [Thermoplasmatota archaeon]